MKGKIVVAFLVVFILSGVADAWLDNDRTEFEKIKRYIELLDGKIVKAREAAQIDKLTWLKELKSKELERADYYRKKIAQSEEKTVGKRGWLAEAGIGGGTLSLGVGYPFVFRNLNLAVDLSYGFGTQYSVITAGIYSVFPVGGNHVGLKVNLSNYSQTVADVPGLSGNIDQGSRFGVGVFGGRKVGPVLAQVGYNTALGFTGGLVYQF
ncbi:hypothetical protein ACFL31_05250 [Candidatus Margulisiibacteriota bacterium]